MREDGAPRQGALREHALERSRRTAGAGVLDVGQVLGDVDVDHRAELAGEPPGLPQRLVGDGEARVQADEPSARGRGSDSAAFRQAAPGLGEAAVPLGGAVAEERPDAEPLAGLRQHLERALDELRRLVVVDERGGAGEERPGDRLPGRGAQALRVERAVEAPPDPAQDLEEARGRGSRRRHPVRDQPAVEVRVRADRTGDDVRARAVDAPRAGHRRRGHPPLRDGEGAPGTVRPDDEGGAHPSVPGEDGLDPAHGPAVSGEGRSVSSEAWPVEREDVDGSDLDFRWHGGDRDGADARRRPGPGRPRRRHRGGAPCAGRRGADRRGRLLRHAGRHRPAHPHAAPHHGHGRRRRLPERHRRGRRRRHDHHPRLRRPRAGTVPRGGARHLAEVGLALDHRPRLPHDGVLVGARLLRRDGPARPGPRRHQLQVLPRLQGRPHAHRRGDREGIPPLPGARRARPGPRRERRAHRPPPGEAPRRGQDPSGGARALAAAGAGGRGHPSCHHHGRDGGRAPLRRPRLRRAGGRRHRRGPSTRSEGGRRDAARIPRHRRLGLRDRRLRPGGGARHEPALPPEGAPGGALAGRSRPARSAPPAPTTAASRGSRSGPGSSASRSSPTAAAGSRTACTSSGTWA